MSKRYLLGGAALAALALLPLTVRRDGLAWELVQLAGFLSAIGCLFLTGASLRPRDARPPRLLTLDRHKWLAWVALALLGAHVGGALVVDRHAVEYLKPSMPGYQLAGLVATFALVILSITALARVRRVLWERPSTFRAVHVLLSGLVVVLIFVHVVATDRYSAGPRLWLWTAITILVLLLPLQRISQGGQPSRWRVAFSRYAKLITIGFSLAALACLSLAAQKGDRRAKLTLESLTPRSQPLMVDFPHERHGTVNCITCHHNFVDRSGVDSCIPCHRSERTDLDMGAEARFHTFCMDCHRDEALPANGSGKHGPVSKCSECHRAQRVWSSRLIRRIAEWSQASFSCIPARHAVYSAPNKKICAL